MKGHSDHDGPSLVRRPLSDDGCALTSVSLWVCPHGCALTGVLGWGSPGTTQAWWFSLSTQTPPSPNKTSVDVWGADAPRSKGLRRAWRCSLAAGCPDLPTTAGGTHTASGTRGAQSSALCTAGSAFGSHHGVSPWQTRRGAGWVSAALRMFSPGDGCWGWQRTGPSSYT